MSRENKFRAWCKDKEFMFNVESLEYNFGNIFVSSDGDEDNSIAGFTDKSIILMQFTGLQDKNKVDIYGSDICESLNGCKAVVEWRVYRWVLRGTDHKGKKFIKNLTANTANHFAQVIGNIHENKELLK